MQIGQMARMASTGVTALAFKALNSSDTLNSLVNRMTGGSINRDTLAQKVLRDAVGLGLEYAADKKLLGDRSASLAPLAGKIFFDNTSDEMHASIKGLANEFLASETSQDPGMLGALKSLGTETMKAGAGGLAHLVANTVTETQFLEKLIATMINGGENWKPLDSYLEKKLEGKPMKGFISNLVKDVIQRAIVDKKELNQNDSNEYRLLAGSANAYLSDGDYKKPLIDYCKNTPVVKLFNNAMEGIKSFTLNSLAVAEKNYYDLVGDPKLKDSFDTYGESISESSGKEKPPPLPLPDAQTSEGQWADESLKHQTVSLFTQLKEATETVASNTLAQAEQQGKINPEKKSALMSVSDTLSPAQTAPFGAHQTTQQVAHYQISGNLNRVATASQASFPLANPTVQAMAAVIDAAPRQEAIKVNYKVADAYAQNVGKLALTFPDDVLGLSDTAQAGFIASTSSIASAFSYSLSSFTTSIFSSSVTNAFAAVGSAAASATTAVLPTAITSAASSIASNYDSQVGFAERTELQKLYKTCGGNEQMTFEVSRYLNPDMAQETLAAPILAALSQENSELLQAPEGLQIKLASTTPQYQYQLRQKDGNVELTIQAAWDVEGYGTDAQQLRSPQGGLPSQLTSSITITVAPNGTVIQSAPSLDCAIRNALRFDTHGALEK